MSAEASPLGEGRSLYAVRRVGLRSDDALCAIAARGDRGAFGAVYERHHQALYRYCLSILGHPEDAFDAVHNAMLKAWEALLRGGPTAPLRPWLFRIAHNEAITVMRRRRAHGQLDDVPTAARSVDETLDTRQRVERLRADLEAMPERQRSALLLRELCGLRHDEIAAVLDVSIATARQAIYEARVALHEAEAGRELACVIVRRDLSDGDGRVRRGRRIRSHLRTCPGCASFDAALRRRPDELAALTPLMPSATVAGLLGRLVGAHGASGAGASAAGGGASAAGGAIATGIAAAGNAISQVASVVATTVAVGTVVAAGAGGVVALGRIAKPPSAHTTAGASTAARYRPGVDIRPALVALPQHRETRAPAVPPPPGASSGPAQSTGDAAPPSNEPTHTPIAPSADADAPHDAAPAGTPAPASGDHAAHDVAPAASASAPVDDAPSRVNPVVNRPRPSRTPAGGSATSPAPRPAPRPVREGSATASPALSRRRAAASRPAPGPGAAASTPGPTGPANAPSAPRHPAIATTPAGDVRSNAPATPADLSRPGAARTPGAPRPAADPPPRSSGGPANAPHPSAAQGASAAPRGDAPAVTPPHEATDRSMPSSVRPSTATRGTESPAGASPHDPAVRSSADAVGALAARSPLRSISHPPPDAAAGQAAHSAGGSTTPGHAPSGKDPSPPPASRAADAQAARSSGGSAARGPANAPVA